MWKVGVFGYSWGMIFGFIFVEWRFDLLWVYIGVG